MSQIDLEFNAEAVEVSAWTGDVVRIEVSKADRDGILEQMESEHLYEQLVENEFCFGDKGDEVLDHFDCDTLFAYLEKVEYEFPNGG